MKNMNGHSAHYEVFFVLFGKKSCIVSIKLIKVIYAQGVIINSLITYIMQY